MDRQQVDPSTLREISAQLIEEFKNNRLTTPTKKNTPRRPATVNRELTLLSSAYSLAVKYDKAESNPCSKVDLFTLDNLRYRYLMPDEEPRLMAALTGPRAHLQPIVTVALGTGLRMSEQLQMKRHQVDFLRNIVTARHTKNGRPRDIPMNDDVTQALADLCRDKRPDDYVFVSEKTGSCIREVKKRFHTACRIAGIESGKIFGPRLAPGWLKPDVMRSRSRSCLDNSDVRVTMRYVRAVETSKRVAVEAVRLNSGKLVTYWAVGRNSQQRRWL
jgi:integrase